MFTRNSPRSGQRFTGLYVPRSRMTKVLAGSSPCFSGEPAKSGRVRAGARAGRETKVADPIPAFLKKSLLFIFCLHRNELHVRWDLSDLSVINQDFRFGCVIRVVYTTKPPCMQPDFFAPAFFGPPEAVQRVGL